MDGSRSLKRQEGAEILSTDRGNARRVSLSPENGRIEVMVEKEIDFVVDLENEGSWYLMASVFSINKEVRLLVVAKVSCLKKRIRI